MTITTPRTRWRDIDGILLLDKPGGISSNQALQRARKLLAAAKGGHTGSLDPLATGMLPLCFGEATKIAGVLLGQRKAYRARAVLGSTTDTGDADGAVLITSPVAPLSEVQVESALAPLRGRISQRPPVYSALKQGGEPLYAKARRGEIVEVAEREVEVFSLTLVGQAPGWLDLEVICGSGTYIRSLVVDLGQALGCGAHVGSLRRLWVEPFNQPDMIALERLQALGPMDREACLLPIEAGLASLPRIDLDAEHSRRLGMGQRLLLPGAPAPQVQMAAFGPDGRALGLVELDRTGLLHPRRIFQAAWRPPEN